jgi:hypothetical protein
VRRLIFVIACVVGTAESYAQNFELTAPLARLEFSSASSALDANDDEQLQAVAAWAHQHPWRLLVVEGYADRVGGRAANLALSQNRSDAVRAELMALGVAPERLVGSAYGKEAPDPGRWVIVYGTQWDYRGLLESQRRGATAARHAPVERPPVDRAR